LNLGSHPGFPHTGPVWERGGKVSGPGGGTGAVSPLRQGWAGRRKFSGDKRGTGPKKINPAALSMVSANGAGANFDEQ